MGSNHADPPNYSKRTRDDVRERMRSAVESTFVTVTAMTKAYKPKSEGYKIAKAIEAQLQQQGKTKANEKSKDMQLRNVLGIAAMTRRRVAWLLTGEQPEFEGERVARHELAVEVEHHVEARLAADPAWSKLTRRWDTGIDGLKLLDFLFETVRETSEHLQQTDEVLEQAEAALNVAMRGDATRADVFQAARRVLPYIGHTSADAQQMAGRLFRDWSPSLHGLVVNGDIVTVDRFGAKRRK